MISSETKLQIKKFLKEWIDLLAREIKSRSSDLSATDLRPFREYSTIGNIKPFHESLLPEGILRINEFERTLSTKLGKTYEECGRLIALQHFPVVKREHKITGNVDVEAIRKIEEFVNQVNTHGKPENYLKLVHEIKSIEGNQIKERSRITDLYLKNDKDQEVFFEVKSPKPNKGQCVEILDRHLQIHAIRQEGPPKVRTFFAMAYNPYGSLRENYKHSFALNYLDMENHVLLGHEYWDFLGGPGTNEEIIAIYQEVGKENGPGLLKELAFD